MSLPRLEIAKSEIALSEICAEAEKLGMSYGEYVNYLEKKKQEKKTMSIMTQAELRTAIIKDYNEGMSYGEIAERYQMKPKTIWMDIHNWAKKGWVTLKNEAGDVVDGAKEGIVQVEEQPETKTEQAIKLFEGKKKTVEEAPKPKTSEPKIKFDTALDRLQALTTFAQLIAEFAGKNVEITGVYACNESSQCDCEMNFDGIRYILQMKRAEE